MGLAEVIVNRVARLGGTLVTESNLPLGTFRTPEFIPKITTKPEFELLLNGRMLRRRPGTACYEISSVRRLTKRRSQDANQTTLLRDSSDPVFDSFRRNTLTMTDPQSECFSVKRKYGPADEKVFLRERIAALEDFPDAVREIIQRTDPLWHDQFWTEIINNDLVIALIDWYARHQETSNSAIFLPPTIVVDGNRALDIALAINDAASKSFPTGEDTLVPAGYMILGAKAFKSSEFVNRLVGAVSNLASKHRLVGFKFLDQNDVVNSPVMCPEYSRFLSQMDGIKQQLGDTVVNVAIDSGEAGIATMGNGIDAYVEPLSGFILSHQVGAKTKAEKAKEEVDLDLVRQAYWLHPLERVEKPMSAAEIARLCDCPVHAEIARRTRPVEDAVDQVKGGDSLSPSLLPPTNDEMVALRKIHHYNVRVREVELLAEAVGVGDVTFLNRVLKMGSNQNLLKLLPG